MIPIYVVLIAIVLGGGIAYWNARAAGLAWDDSKIVGGFGRAIIWTGAIQSALGFSAIILGIIAFLLERRHDLTPSMIHWINIVFCVVTIIPCIGAGICLALQRSIEFKKDRDTFSGMRALGTSIAAGEDMANAANSLFSAPKVSEGNSQDSQSSDDKGKGLLLAVLIVGFAILTGVTITYLIVTAYRYDAKKQRTAVPRIRENAVAEVRHRARQIF